MSLAGQIQINQSPMRQNSSEYPDCSPNIHQKNIVTFAVNCFPQICQREWCILIYDSHRCFPTREHHSYTKYVSVI